MTAATPPEDQHGATAAAPAITGVEWTADGGCPPPQCRAIVDMECRERGCAVEQICRHERETLQRARASRRYSRAGV